MLWCYGNEHVSVPWRHTGVSCHGKGIRRMRVEVGFGAMCQSRVDNMDKLT